MRPSEFQRGVIAAANIASDYDSSSTHLFRLGDCILGKLNVSKRKKPRQNQKALRHPSDAWLSGYAIALAEMHRRLLHGNDSSSVRELAHNAGLTLKSARDAGVSSFDLRELRKAGVR